MDSVWILSKHDLSNYENKRLVYSMETIGLSACLIDPSEFNLCKTTELPKAVLVRTGSGSEYKHLAFIKELESENIPVFNSSSSTQLTKDKLHTFQVLKKFGIPTPKTMLVSYPLDLDTIEKEIGFPCVVKVITGSYGSGVQLIESKKVLKDFLTFVKATKPKRSLIIQEFVKEKIGTDLRVWCIDGTVVGVMQRSNPSDFRANVSIGGTGTPYPITSEIRDIANRVMTAFGLHFAGIDLLFGKDGFKVCEVNSSPGFEGMEKYCCVLIAEAIAKFIKDSIKY